MLENWTNQPANIYSNEETICISAEWYNLSCVTKFSRS